MEHVDRSGKVQCSMYSGVGSENGGGGGTCVPIRAITVDQIM